MASASEHQTIQLTRSSPLSNNKSDSAMPKNLFESEEELAEFRDKQQRWTNFNLANGYYLKFKEEDLKNLFSENYFSCCLTNEAFFSSLHIQNDWTSKGLEFLKMKMTLNCKIMVTKFQT